MKTELDGAFTKETWSIGPGGDGDTREAEEADKQLDAYYALGAMRKECEEQWEKLDGLKGEKIDRHRSDLRDLNGLIEECEKAMREGRWERAVRVAIDVGSYKRKARLRRQLEKGVLQVRAARKKAAYAAAKTKRDNRPKLDAEDRPKYRKRMLKLRKEGVKYGQAAFIIETEFRKKKRDRHHAKRIRELAPNPIPLKDSIPPKDYVR